MTNRPALEFAPPLLGDDDPRATVLVLSALAHPKRVQIVRALNETGQMTSAEACRVLGHEVDAVAHLRKLEAAGIVQHEGRGELVEWELVPDALDKVADLLDSGAPNVPSAERLKDRFLSRLRIHHQLQVATELSVVDEARRSYRRVDALIVWPGTITAVEIKMSRADLARDTRAKRAPWMRHADEFVYAVPSGMVFPGGIDDPNYDGCGLWWINEDGSWHTKKAATRNRSGVGTVDSARVRGLIIPGRW